MRWIRLLLAMACPLIFLPGSACAEEKAAAKPLTVGLMPYLSTRALLANYQPVANTLEQDLKQPVQLLTAPDFDTFVKRVLQGEYDVALLAPHYARLAIKDYGYTPILLHAAPIRAVLVTARSNPLNDLSELRGHSVAIVERSAIMAINGAVTLAEEGLKENTDYRFVETVTHSSALHNAVTGKSRAAIMSYSALLLAPQELQRDAVVFREMARIPGMFYLAHSRISPARQAAIKAALRHFEKTPEGVAFFEKTSHAGFREVTREDNDSLDRVLPETRRLLGNIAN